MASDGEKGRDFTDQLLEIGITLLKDFFYEWIQRRVEDITVTREELGAEEIKEPGLKKIAQCFLMIGDELDGDTALQKLMNNPAITPDLETFKKLASYIFSDGKINWGRVGALFYMACKLVIKAYGINIVEIIKTVIRWTIDFLRENVINWIKQQGGWEGVVSYFGTPTWQTVLVFLAGVFTTIMVMRKV